MFKYIKYFFDARSAYEKPDEFLADTSFGIVQGFFILSFIVLGLLGGGFIAAGIHYDQGFMRFIGILLVSILALDIFVFIRVKKNISRIAKRTVDYGRKQVQHYREIK